MKKAAAHILEAVSWLELALAYYAGHDATALCLLPMPFSPIGMEMGRKEDFQVEIIKTLTLTIITCPFLKKY